MASVLNKAQVKQLALSVSQQDRGGKFTRVGGDFINRIESKTRALIAAEVRAHPTKGVTLL